MLSLRNHYFRKRLRRNRFADHTLQLSRWSSSFRTLKHRPVCGASGEQVSPVLFQLLPEQHYAVVLCQQTELFSCIGRRSFSIRWQCPPAASGGWARGIILRSYWSAPTFNILRDQNHVSTQRTKSNTGSEQFVFSNRKMIISHGQIYAELT